jgi:hypothetical protein
MTFQLASNLLQSVSIVDTNNNLSIYHYNQCDINSEDAIKRYRGIVMDKDGNVVCKSFDFTPELDENECDEEVEKFFSSSSQVTALKSYEATLIRVYWNLTDDLVGGWYMSTCRKLDAFKSRWGGSKSFGELFQECIGGGDFQEWCNEKLDKSKVYCYIIRTYDANRIVCKGFDKPQLYLVGTFTGEEFDITSCEIECVSASSLTEVKEEMTNIDHLKEQGLILINERGKCLKVLKHEYVEAFKLRGNQPNILLRYVELQHEGDASRVEKFFNMYEEHKELIINFTTVLEDVCNFVFRKYRNRFIRKQVAIVPPELYHIIRDLHTEYLKNRECIVTPERVNNYILSLEPMKLLNIYNNYTKRKEEFGNGNKLPREFMDKVKAMIV